MITGIASNVSAQRIDGYKKYIGLQSYERDGHRGTSQEVNLIYVGKNVLKTMYCVLFQDYFL